MFIHNDVAVTGTSAFVYRSCQPSFITSRGEIIILMLEQLFRLRRQLLPIVRIQPSQRRLQIILF